MDTKIPSRYCDREGENAFTRFPTNPVVAPKNIKPSLAKSTYSGNSTIPAEFNFGATGPHVAMLRPSDRLDSFSTQAHIKNQTGTIRVPQDLCSGDRASFPSLSRRAGGSTGNSSHIGMTTPLNSSLYLTPNATPNFSFSATAALERQAEQGRVRLSAPNSLHPYPPSDGNGNPPYIGTTPYPTSSHPHLNTHGQALHRGTRGPAESCPPNLWAQSSSTPAVTVSDNDGKVNRIEVPHSGALHSSTLHARATDTSEHPSLLGVPQVRHSGPGGRRTAKLRYPGGTRECKQGGGTSNAVEYTRMEGLVSVRRKVVGDTASLSSQRDDWHQDPRQTHDAWVDDIVTPSTAYGDQSFVTGLGGISTTSYYTPPCPPHPPSSSGRRDFHNSRYRNGREEQLITEGGAMVGESVPLPPPRVRGGASRGSTSLPEPPLIRSGGRGGGEGMSREQLDDEPRSRQTNGSRAPRLKNRDSDAAVAPARVAGDGHVVGRDAAVLSVVMEGGNGEIGGMHLTGRSDGPKEADFPPNRWTQRALADKRLSESQAASLAPANTPPLSTAKKSDSVCRIGQGEALPSSDDREDATAASTQPVAANSIVTTATKEWEIRVYENGVLYHYNPTSQLSSLRCPLQKYPSTSTTCECVQKWRLETNDDGLSHEPLTPPYDQQHRHVGSSASTHANEPATHDATASNGAERSSGQQQLPLNPEPFLVASSQSKSVGTPVASSVFDSDSDSEESDSDKKSVMMCRIQTWKAQQEAQQHWDDPEAGCLPGYRAGDASDLTAPQRSLRETDTSNSMMHAPAKSYNAIDMPPATTMNGSMKPPAHHMPYQRRELYIDDDTSHSSNAVQSSRDTNSRQSDGRSEIDELARSLRPKRHRVKNDVSSDTTSDPLHLPKERTGASIENDMDVNILPSKNVTPFHRLSSGGALEALRCALLPGKSESADPSPAATQSNVEATPFAGEDDMHIPEPKMATPFRRLSSGGVLGSLWHAFSDEKKKSSRDNDSERLDEDEDKDQEVVDAKDDVSSVTMMREGSGDEEDTVENYPAYRSRKGSYAEMKRDMLLKRTVSHHSDHVADGSVKATMERGMYHCKYDLIPLCRFACKYRAFQHQDTYVLMSLQVPHS